MNLSMSGSSIRSIIISLLHISLIWFGLKNGVDWAKNLGLFWTWFAICIIGIVSILMGIVLASGNIEFIDKMRSEMSKPGYTLSTYISRICSFVIVLLLVVEGYFITGAIFLISTIVMVFIAMLIKEVIKKLDDKKEK